jgi:hypothetical protein
VTTRGGRLPGTFRLVGVTFVALGLLALAKRYLAEGMLNDLTSTYEWPVAVGLLVVGAVLIWLSRR